MDITTRPIKRLPRVQSSPAQLQSLDTRHERPAPAECPYPTKVLRTCLSMSNMAAAEVHLESANRTYTFQTNVNGAPRKFNFSPTDTIQSMIDTMGKTSLKSSASCQSISEDAVYNEGLLYESNTSLFSRNARVCDTDGLSQFVEAVNSGQPLVEDAMRTYLHPSIQIQEPGGEYSGLCACCLLYTSDAADEEDSVDLGGCRIIQKTNNGK
eukprot:TRINITY_DN13626_c0_g1_i4.p1 TRINITY_DN13626_c0_g1~~TRINITY_DN13626_c0_g1_i4.p1  ORF type:complete len:211 (+),score=41.06 TRINITY_DN13626_c0_g1_i4:120-752(+)